MYINYRFLHLYYTKDYMHVFKQLASSELFFGPLCVYAASQINEQSVDFKQSSAVH